MNNARDAMFSRGTGMSGTVIGRAALLASLLVTLSLPVRAQTAAIPTGFFISATATDSISATTTSASKTLTASPTVWATNQGSVSICVDWGANPLPSFPCPQGKQITGGQTGTFPVLGAAKFAAITQTGSATVGLVEGFIAPSHSP